MTAPKRHITLDLQANLIAHLDSRAAFYGCSRAAYLRRLILEDALRHHDEQQQATA